MEKLSGILPNSPRVKSVDVSEAKPRRPGAPTFGLPNGSTAAVRDKVSLSNIKPEEVGSDTLTYKNLKDAKSAKLADDLAKKFFETRLNPQEENLTKSEELATALEPEAVTAPQIENTQKSMAEVA